MQMFIILLGYLNWHYGKALYSLTAVWRNFFYFISDFFSIRLLFRNFFSHWKRMAEKYPTSFDLKGIFFAFVINIIVRLVGMIMRSFLIILAIFCYLLLIILYPLTVIIWLILPLLSILSIIYGLFIIFFTNK